MKTKEKIIILLILYLVETLNRFVLTEEQKETLSVLRKLTKDCSE